MSDVNDRLSLGKTFQAISQCHLHQAYCIDNQVSRWIKGKMEGLELVQEIINAKATLDVLHRNILLQERAEDAFAKAEAEAFKT